MGPYQKTDGGGRKKKVPKKNRAQCRKKQIK